MRRQPKRLRRSRCGERMAAGPPSMALRSPDVTRHCKAYTLSERPCWPMKKQGFCYNGAIIKKGLLDMRKGFLMHKQGFDGLPAYQAILPRMTFMSS
jgi:hypothetical protein